MTELKMYVRCPELKPTRAHADDAGLDVYADMSEIHKDKPLKDRYQVINAGYRLLVCTGVFVAIPVGYELQCRSRSGLALKNGICVLNSPGTIDPQYRGEIGIIIQNDGHDPFAIRHGDKLAQLVMAPVIYPTIAYVDSVEALGDTTRGAKGYGSTGV